MLKRCGQVKHPKERTLDVLITNPIGQTYKINFTMSYVWTLLDGQTDNNSIAQKIIEMCNHLDLSQAKSIVDNITDNLKKVGLAKQTAKNIHTLSNPL